MRRCLPRGDACAQLSRSLRGIAAQRHHKYSMFVDLPKHPLFSDFKGTPITPELMICYPAGAGANFLFNNLQGGSRKSDQRNEYEHPPAFRCPMDRVQYTRDRWSDPLELESHLWKMYSIAQGCTLTHNGSPWKFAQFHNVPYMTHLVFDLRADEIVYIEPDDESDWFITALAIVKHGFQPFGSSQFLINTLINIVISSGLDTPLDPSALISYENLLDTPELSGIGNTLAFWSYVINSTAESTSPSRDGFRSHIDWMMRNKPLVIDDYYLAVIDQLSSRTEMQRRIKYSELYFDFDIPQDGALSRLSKDDMLTYTNNNINQVKSLIDILADETAAFYRSKLFEIQKRVTGAAIP